MIISIISIMTFSSNYHTHKKNSNKTTRNYDIHYYSFIKSYYITLYNHSHHSRHRHHSHHSHHSHDTPVAHLQPRRHCKICAGHVAWCLGMMSFLRDDEKLNSKDCNTQPKTNIIQHYFTQQLENYPTNFTQQKKRVLSKNFITQLRILQHSPTWLRTQLLKGWDTPAGCERWNVVTLTNSN